MSKSSLEFILDRLGLLGNKNLYFEKDLLANVSIRLRNSLKYIKYDALYLVKNNPLILFKEFKTKNQFNSEIEALRKGVWNLSEVPILFIIIPNQIYVYNGNFLSDDNILKDLNLKDNDLLDSFTYEDKKLENFDVSNLTSGNIWNIYQNKFNKKETIQDYLLDNLNTARTKLIEEGLSVSIIHSLFGRLLFSRYLIDREVLSQDFFIEEYKSEFTDLIRKKDSLYEFFEYLKKNFNGDIFPILNNELFEVKNSHLKILSELFKGTSLKTSQTVLFDIYDFKIIPIELISSIYEAFLNYEGTNNSKKAYYTPLFLVDYILEETLDIYLENNDICRILDPSCGSGVFLVESLRRIIEKSKKEEKHNFKDLFDLAKKSIFGIDKDEDAINISIFSISITLLDYLDNKEIEDLKLPKFKNENFFVSDFFNTSADFNKLKDFDLILGNPPWGKDKGIHNEYSSENNGYVSRNQIAQSFLIRVKDFVNDNSLIALLITSKILYDHDSVKFRKNFLKIFKVDKVLETSSLRNEIFNNAIGPGSVIFYKKNKKNEKNKTHFIEHVSLKPSKLFYLLKNVIIQKFDTKFIPQDFLIKNDWAWKSLVYGNILDLELIKRLKQEDTIDDYAEKLNLKTGQGIRISPKEKDASKYLNQNFLDTQKKMLQRYYIDEIESKWKEKLVNRIRDEKLFEPPYVLIKKGIDKDFRAVATFSNDKWVFKDGVTSLKGNPKHENILKNFLGIINSKFLTYYAYLTFSSVGIEREQGLKAEWLSIPIREDDSIVKYVNKLLKIKKNANEKDISNKEKIIQTKLDNKIFDLFYFNDLEKDLVDYAFEVSMPMYQSKRKMETVFKKIDENYLKKYINVFVEHFKGYFDSSKKEFFYAEAFLSDQFIGIAFKVSNIPIDEIQFRKSNILDFLGHLSVEKRNSLYLQRDIRGFESDYFYIIKPNEFKNWHRGVARHDVVEFMKDLTDLEGL